jgi:hypothetical protein
MPPWFYGILHSEARFSDQEKQEIVAGLRVTFGSEDDDGGEEDDD